MRPAFLFRILKSPAFVEKINRRVVQLFLHIDGTHTVRQQNRLIGMPQTVRREVEGKFVCFQTAGEHSASRADFSNPSSSVLLAHTSDTTSLSRHVVGVD